MTAPFVLSLTRTLLLAGYLVLSVTACGSGSKNLMTHSPGGKMRDFHRVRREPFGVGARENRGANQFVDKLSKLYVERDSFAVQSSATTAKGDAPALLSQAVDSADAEVLAILDRSLSEVDRATAPTLEAGRIDWSSSL